MFKYNTYHKAYLKLKAKCRVPTNNITSRKLRKVAINASKISKTCYYPYKDSKKEMCNKQKNNSNLKNIAKKLNLQHKYPFVINIHLTKANLKQCQQLQKYLNNRLKILNVKS